MQIYKCQVDYANYLTKTATNFKNALVKRKSTCPLHSPTYNGLI